MDQSFWFSYLLGLLVIVLYSRDKFEVPTHDRAAMGPFAHSPLSFFTIDSRYRAGLSVYTAAIVCIYTAICIIGPATFQSYNQTFALGAIKSPTAPVQWPLIAAAFLVSTAAASDESVLGRLEHIVRRYAHNTAYIPWTVREIAEELRTADLVRSHGGWKPTALSRSIEGSFERLCAELGVSSERGDNESDDAVSWRRLLGLMSVNEHVFEHPSLFRDPRLQLHVELPENKRIYDDLKKRFEELRPSEDRLPDKVRALLTDASLAAAVALSRSSTSTGELNEYFEDMGFRSVQLFNYGALPYQVKVCVTVVAAYIGALVVFFLYTSRSGDALPGKVFVEIQSAAIALMPGMVLYPISLFVIDAYRNRSILYENRHDSVDGWIGTIGQSIIVSSIITMIVVSILSVPIGGFDKIAYSIGTLSILYISMLILCMLCAIFTVYYFIKSEEISAEEVVSDLKPEPSEAVEDGGAGGERSSGRPLRSYLVCALHGILAGLVVYNVSVLTFRDQLESRALSSFSNVMRNFQAVQDLLSPGAKNALPYYYDDADRHFIWSQLAAIRDQWSGSYVGEPTSEVVNNKIKKLDSVCNVLRSKKKPKVEGAEIPTNGAALPLDAACRYDLLYESEKYRFDLERKQVQGEPTEQRDITWFLNFVKPLEAFRTELESLTDRSGTDKAVIFPAVGAFVLAVAYGVSSIAWRSRWLSDEWKREGGWLSNLKRYFEVAGNPLDDIDRNKKIRELNNLTFLNALQHEGLRRRLRRLISNGRLSDFQQRHSGPPAGSPS